MTNDEKQGIWFVYDGECPICQMGASLYEVKQKAGTLHTVDARTQQDHPVFLEVQNAGLDLDEGMVIKYNDTLYQGAQALHIMAELGAADGWFNQINNSLFKSEKLATLCYPSMRAVRNMLLKAKGIEKIRNLERHHHE